QPSAENRVITLPNPGNVTPFSVLMVDDVPDLSLTAAKSGTQCYPQWLYEEVSEDAEGELALSVSAPRGLVRRDAITDAGLAHFQAAHPGHPITKDDLFYYVYGLLHSPDYRERFADNLSKELPRMPAMARYEDFRAFVEAGRQLGDLHCDYDEAEPYPVTIAQGALELAHIPDPVSFYRVEKMRFGGKRPNLDKSTIIYNANITITGVPLEAYDYVVNGKSAIDWVMERQVVKTD